MMRARGFWRALSPQALTALAFAGGGGATLGGLALVLAAPVLADAVAVHLQVDRHRITAEDQVQLDVVIEGRSDQPTLPPLDDFDVYPRGSSQSIQIVNGNYSASTSYTYLLAPKHEGTFTVGPVVIKRGGKDVRSNTVTITVMSAGSAPAGPSGAGGAGGTAGGEDANAEDRDLYVVARVDKANAYVNEQIIYTFYLYRRVEFTNHEYHEPVFQGFWTEKLSEGEKQYMKVINGRRYTVHEVSTAIFPTTSGTLTIPPATLRLVVLTSPFGFSLFDRGQERLLHTRPIEVRVSPLPAAGKPAIFDGAVGEDLTLTAKLDRTEVEAGDPVTLTMRVEGTGNVKTFSKPRLPDLPQFKTYDSDSKTESAAQDRVAGTRTYEVVLVPKDEGDHTISAVRLAYFDTKEARYRTLETKPMQLTVVKSSHPERALAENGPPQQQEVQILGQDIAHIRTDIPLDDELTPLYRHGLFMALLPLPVLGLLGAGLLQRRREKLASDVALARSTRARKTAKRHLAAAEKDLGSGNGEAFYAEVSRALRQYAGDKLNVSAVGLTHDQLRERLAAAGVVGDTSERLLDLLERCDAARFAPGSYQGERLREVLGEAEGLVVELEGRWRRGAASAAPPALPLVLLACGLGASCVAFSPARAFAQVTSQSPSSSSLLSSGTQQTPPPDGGGAAPPPTAVADFAPPAELVRRGHAAYEAGRFADAIAAYAQAEQAGVRNGPLYYDLGNAYYKNGELGRALACYRRAEMLSPRDAQVRSNLEFARSRREDKPLQRRDNWFVVVGRDYFRLTNLNETIVIVVALYLIACALIAWRLLRRDDGAVPRLALYLCGCLLLLGSLTLAFKVNAERGVKRGVITVSKVSVMSGPGQDYTVEFSLHEGAEVQVEEHRPDWLRVSMGGKLRGWVPATSLAPI